MDNETNNLFNEVWQINTTGTSGIGGRTDIAMGSLDDGTPAIRIGEHVFTGIIPAPFPEGGTDGAVLTKVVTDGGEHIEWKPLPMHKEDWTFTIDDGSTVTKQVLLFDAPND